MRKLVLPLLLVAALGASSGVMAAGYGSGATMVAPAMHAPAAHALAMATPLHLKLSRGTIKLIDAKACTITLASRNVYQFGPSCDFSRLKVGERVSIKWAPKGKLRDATLIAAR
ncbi:MAG TPA: hypothetical protein VGV07_15260 [Devosia sp.]|jgi:hypothetical protein|uniref:hypothetical protein n=1 Tax=Devosia sp. TaxID=1871048 RepID=UPI002DDD7F59|nr:hypothetical protein [Devosia sp.]HEV2516613.1 hypothetical protein [Devosia sp.]